MTEGNELPWKIMKHLCL